MAINKNFLLFGVSIFIAIVILILHFLPFQAIISYSITYVLSSVAFIILFLLVRTEQIGNRQIFILLAIFIVIRLSFINTTPIGSDDIYRYMWDGKVQASGINPYLYKPIDPNLNHLHSNILPKMMNFKEMKTIYFPLSQWLFFAAYSLSGQAVWGYKILIFLFEMLTLCAFYLLFKETKTDFKFILLYFLCPIFIFQFAIDAHLDAFGFPLLLLSLYFYFRKKLPLAGLFLGLSIAIKPVGLVIAPILFLDVKGIKAKLELTAAAFLAFALQFLPYIFNSNPFEAFLIYSRHWMFNGFIFNLINSLVHNNQTARSICTLMMIASLVPLYFSRKSLINKIYFAVILLIVFSPVVHPWYIGWLALLIPLNQKWSGLLLTALSSLTIITVANYQLNGVWKDYWLVQIAEYVPAIAFLIWEMFVKKNNILEQ